MPTTNSCSSLVSLILSVRLFIPTLVCPSVYPYPCLSVCLSLPLSVHLFIPTLVCLSVCLSIPLSVRLFIPTLVCPSVYPYPCLSVYPYPCLSVCLSLPLSVCLFIPTPVCLQLYANMEYRIPTPVLLSFYLFSLRNATTNCPSELLDRHPLDLFTSGFSPLSLCFSSQCPFVSVALEASICRNFSRTAIHLPEEEDQLREQQFGLLPEKNCSVLAGDLPRNIYMGKLDSYRISVTFQLLGLGE